MSLFDSVEALVQARDLAVSGLSPILLQLRDTSIELEDRWDAYKNLVQHKVLTTNEGYGDGFINTLGDNLTLYDDFYIERHQTSTFVAMYDRLMEADPSFDQALVKARETKLAAWQEQVLASGFASFTYDW